MGLNIRTVTRQGAGRQSVSAKKDWCTPHKYVDAVRRVFGGEIELDPCSNRHSIVKARTEYRLPETDGLRVPWNFSTIYVNPPYGNDKENGTRIRDWLARCAQAHSLYGSEVIALVPVATNTSHWKQYVFTQAYGVCFLYDTRLKFLEDGKHGGKGAPMSCAMIYWGACFRRFRDVFIDHGAVVDISDLRDRSVANRQPLLKLIA
jgi:hypothetical protein